MAQTTFDLSTLDGTNGFKIDGLNAGDIFGNAVTLADVNGDGFADIAVGALGLSPNGTFSGGGYVILGHSGAFDASFDLTSLDGSNGYTFNGPAAYGPNQYAFVGQTIQNAGDFNGDGFDDLLMSSANGPNGVYSGSVYVVFGKASGFGATLELSGLNGTDGFQVPALHAREVAKYSGGVGDINGDGIDDLAVTSLYAGTGTSYVIFGTTIAMGARFDVSTLDGTNGMMLTGPGPNFRDAVMTSAGDINGDGFNDLLISAPYATVGGGNKAGEAYVVFGTNTGFAASTNLGSLDGTNGFALVGSSTTHAETGKGACSIGDFNGDGLSDIAIGSPSATSASGIQYAGAVYVVYGKSGSSFGASVDLTALDGTNGGFRIEGTSNLNEFLGSRLSSAGDFNGDGLDDLLISNFSGEAFVLYGKQGGFGENILATDITGASGFKIASDDIFFGRSVSGGGDINGDGFDDIVIGSPYTGSAGATYVIFGHDNPALASADAFSTPESALLGTGKSLFDDNGSGADTGALGVIKINNKAANVGSEITLKSGAHLTVNADGTFSYDQHHAFDSLPGSDSGASNTTATDSFVYTINGGSKATVTITITGVDSDGDYLVGTSGNDKLNGGTGGDIMIGGAGDDTYFVNSEFDTVTEKKNQGTDAVRTTTSSYTLGNYVENLSFTGTGNFVGTGNALANAVSGGSGNDTLDGKEGADTLAGSLGNDTYIVDTLDDIVTEKKNQGTDTVKTALDGYSLGGNVENLTYTGSGHFTAIDNLLDNTIVSGAGEDTFYMGGGGDDVIKAGGGNDTFSFGTMLTASDRVDGEAGIDTLNLSGRINIVFDSATVRNVEVIKLSQGYDYTIATHNATVAKGAALTVDGSSLGVGDNITFDGSAEKDGKFILKGGAGNDTFIGGASGNTFGGSLGNDAFTAGAKVDTFVYTAAEQSTGKAFDSITGFNAATDRFDLKVAINGIDAAITTGRLTGSGFDTDMASATDASHLGAHHAVLFTADAGTLAGETFLVVDLNGTAGYQSGADLVIALDSFTGTIGTSNFI